MGEQSDLTEELQDRPTGENVLLAETVGHLDRPILQNEGFSTDNICYSLLQCQLCAHLYQ